MMIQVAALLIASVWQSTWASEEGSLATTSLNSPQDYHLGRTQSLNPLSHRFSAPELAPHLLLNDAKVALPDLSSSRRRAHRSLSKGIAGRLKDIFSKIKKFFSKESLLQKAQVDGAIDAYVASPEGSSTLVCVVAHTEDEARKKGSKFCAKFKEEHIREICNKYVDEAIFILRAAAEKCSAPVKGDCLLQNLRLPIVHPLLTERTGPSEYHLKDVSIPSFSPEEFSESSRWEQITKLEGLYSADSPTRWTLHERVKRESTRLSEKAAKKSKKQRDKDLYFWRAWQLVAHLLGSKPHVDTLLVRLVLLFLSFKSCSKKKIVLTIKGRRERAAASDTRRKALLSAFAESLHIRDCAAKQEEFNCQVLSHFVALDSHLKAQLQPLNDINVPKATIPAFALKKEESNISNLSGAKQLTEEIEEDLEADVTYANTVAASVGSKLMDVIAKSRMARVLMASIVSGVLRFVDSFRGSKKSKTESASSASKASKIVAATAQPSAQASSKATIAAIAYLMGASRAASVYLMTAKNGLAELQAAIVQRVLRSRLMRERAKQKPKVSIKDRLKNIRKSDRKEAGAQSFLLSSSKLYPEKSFKKISAAAACGRLCKLISASYLQSVEEAQGIGTTGKLLLAGGAFLFIGISMLGTMVPGGLVAGLIIAGVIALLIPLIKRVMEFLSGRGGGKAAEGGEEEELMGGGEAEPEPAQEEEEE
ncbi:hypothetical protein, conserved [Eimeria tenella]|uniref:Transmembrane protein n=1 Tax=Eimeria tenella TaxID=5802 RepID=U6L0L6_EIMTE|nr:hypothetical protein, conserved [Eimeria tenella]CDJ42129.1 hypothetical protein, conserved [Eimeria tenella]|eukprot:XP_013232879.1 hypothetical protein, conserved [Eimeria tenella]